MPEISCRFGSVDQVYVFSNIHKTFGFPKSLSYLGNLIFYYRLFAPSSSSKMMPYSIYQKVGVGEQGMTNSGFEIWTVWCIFDHKYKNKSTIAA